MNKNKKTFVSSAAIIRILDGPLRLRLGLTSLPSSSDEDTHIEDGMVVSEVGFATAKSHPAYPKPFVSYDLRAPRVNKIPSFIFGSMQLADAYGAFLHKIISAPAVGANIVVNPYFTPMQAKLIADYSFISYDVHWIMHIPAPLGTGTYLEVYAPELDSTVKTRGVRFKPSVSSSIAFHLPYSNDLSLVPIGVGRKGQCGGSIVIKTIEDNSSDSLNTPLNITLFCCVYNICCTGFKTNNDTPVSDACLNFQPVTAPPPPQHIIQCMDGESTEVTAEVVGEPTDQTVDATPAVPLAPPVEQEAPTPVNLPANAAVNKPDVGLPATKWFEYQTITVGSDDLDVWKTVTFNPYTFTTKGEAFNLPFKRNVWTSGARPLNYLQTIYFQMNIARTPYVSGTLLIKDSANATSEYLVGFGEKSEFPVIPVVYNGKDATKPRDWTTPWLRTSRCSVAFQYKLIAFNRTADVAGTVIKVMVRHGNSRFQTPTKPTKRVIAPWGTSLMSELMAELELSEEKNRPMPIVQCMNDGRKDFPMQIPLFSSAPLPSYMTPFAAVNEEFLATHSELGVCEELDVDEFPIEVFNGEIDVGAVTEIPLQLPVLLDISSNDDEDNAITQKFDRFANIIPRSGGPYGPIVGSYTVKMRLPTSVAGEIRHVCLPGDMSDEAALMIFGLGSILGMAGSALSSVGGPLISGLVNTIAPVINGLSTAVGGEALGGLTDSILGGLSNIFPGNNTSSLPPAPGPVNPASVPAAITGGIPISRFVEYLKPILANYTSDPVFPTLLLEAMNFVGGDMSAISKVPIQVLANMRNVKVEREVFDRSVAPLEGFRNDVILTPDMFPRIMEAFVNHPKSRIRGTIQNMWFKRFLTLLRANKLRDGNVNSSITLSELRAISDNSDDENLFSYVTLFGAGEARTFGRPE